MTETWTVGYTARDFNAPDIAIDDEGHIETKFQYAYYRSFAEAKSALLAILGTCGLDMMRSDIDRRYVANLAQAAIEFMHMTEDEFKDGNDNGDPMVCDLDGIMGFFLMNREVKPDEAKIRGLSFELVADHRHCTEDFCYGEGLEANLN